MTKRTLVLVATSVLGIAACRYVPVLHAQAAMEQQEPSRTATFGMTADATVKAVDPSTRTITLTNTDGEDVVVKCGRRVQNFDQFKVGDKVRAAAFARIVAAMGNEPGAADAADATSVIRTPEGGQPGAIIIRTKQRTAKIDSIDPANRTLSLSGLDDQKNLKVPIARDLDLSKLKVGDEVTLRVSKGVAIWEPGAEGARPAAGRIPGEGQAEAAERGTATVTECDPAKGTVTIKGAEGREREIQMRPGSENFERIKVGDKVGALVVPEMCIAIRKAGAAPQEGPGMAILEARGAKPGCLMCDTDEVTGKVQSVDAPSHTIVIVEPDGDARTFRTAPRVELSDLKPGDDVTARVTQVVVIKVENQ